MKYSIYVGLLIVSVLAALAEDVVIESFDTNGKITFNMVSNVTSYRVEWTGIDENS